MKQRARQLHPALEPAPLGVARTRALRRRQDLVMHEARRRARRAKSRKGSIKNWLFSGAASSTVTNPSRDAKSHKSGRLRRERQP